MFSSDEIQGQNNNTPITAGPSVAVELVSVTKGDKNELKFNFKGTDKSNTGVFTHTEFEVDPTHEKWTEEGQKRVLARILHIGARFADEDTVRKSFKGNNWEEYSNNVIAFFKDRTKGVPLKAKITIRESNGKVYNQFPMFPNFLSSEKHPTAFSTSPGYDKYTAVPVTDKPDDMSKPTEELPF